MTKKYIRIAELIYKDKIGELTEQEKNELLVWLEESDFNLSLIHISEPTRLTAVSRMPSSA